MDDVTDNLVHWTWYSTRFLGELEKARVSGSDEPIKSIEGRCVTAFNREGKFSNREFPILNPGYLAMFAYGILVVPKEVMSTDGSLTSDFRFDTRDQFTFIKPRNYNQESNNILKKMRNSISHANFTFQVDQASGCSLFTFWDEYKGTENFRVTLTNEGFWNFLDEAGKYYAEKVGVVK